MRRQGLFAKVNASPSPGRKEGLPGTSRYFPCNPCRQRSKSKPFLRLAPQMAQAEFSGISIDAARRIV